MQTSFSLAQLADPDVAESEKILRACVHCGFCTATCPTYVVLGDELDSPRGRIYLIKGMLEGGGPATPTVVKHVDRCLSCLSCMTTCPSGVHYMHLVDHARVHIEETYRRPLLDRLMRQVLASVLPYPRRFRTATALARVGRPFRGLLPARLKAMLDLAPARTFAPTPANQPGGRFPAQGSRRRRVALLPNCIQPLLRPEINEAAVRVLTRLGVEVVVPQGLQCCGSLVHHMGRESTAKAQAKAAIDAILAAADDPGGLDALVLTVSGCGTTVKDYGHMFRTDPAYAEKAARVSALAKDVSEVLADLLDPFTEAVGALEDRPPSLRVAYHGACSLQHGQGVRAAPKTLLAAAGFTVMEPVDGHLCCGSAGTYNLLQPEIAGQLRDRKVATLEALRPHVVASGNIGCLTQIESGTTLPAVHTVELLDWALGGPRPAALAGASA